MRPIDAAVRTAYDDSFASNTCLIPDLGRPDSINTRRKLTTLVGLVARHWMEFDIVRQRAHMWTVQDACYVRPGCNLSLQHRISFYLDTIDQIIGSVLHTLLIKHCP